MFACPFDLCRWFSVEPTIGSDSFLGSKMCSWTTTLNSCNGSNFWSQLLRRPGVVVMCRQPKANPKFRTGFAIFSCNRPVPLQSPGTPKPQKFILKSEKCHFGPPGKWPKKSIKMSKKSLFGHFKSPKIGHFNWLLGPFFWGVQNCILRTLKCTFGVWGFRGSVGGPGDCKFFSKKDLTSEERGIYTNPS